MWVWDALVSKMAEGLSRAKAGVMRRLSMVALRATARHVLRSLANRRPVVHPPAQRPADAAEHRQDAFGPNRGAPLRDP